VELVTSWNGALTQFMWRVFLYMVCFEIPEIHSDFGGFDKIADISGSLQNTWDNEVVFNCQRCIFFDGDMTAPLQMVIRQLVERLEQRNLPVHVRFEHIPQDVEHALRRNQFLTEYEYKALPDFAGSSMPLRRFSCGDSSAYYQYLGALVDMIDQPEMSLSLTKALKRNLCEIMINACEHAKSGIGFFCCAQYFSSDRKLSFSFSDGGVGIRQNVSEFKKREFTDMDAIEWAIKSGNSTKRGPGGLGLDFIRQFIALNRGKLSVISGQCFYSIVPEASPRIMHNSLCGTTIHLEINTSDTKSYSLGAGETM